MFKIIGFGVVALVLFWGFDSIRKWYEGDATPQEAVGEVRKTVGEKIPGADNESSADKPLGTDDMLKKLMKD